MKILVLSQVFWPDNVAVSLFMTDLCEQLCKRGHQVSVLAGRYNYEDCSIRYPERENWQGVQIYRLASTGLGKKSNLSRATDFLTFNLSMLFKLFQVSRKEYDLVISTTVPPMLSFFVSLITPIKKFRFCYWAMDLQPELSIHSGLIRTGSAGARLLTTMGDRVFKKADLVLALDDYMRSHIVKRGGHPDRIRVSRLWPVMNQVDASPRLQNPFRKAHNWADKVVVMYSGNHSLIHPLKTLLEAAKKLKYRSDILFVFIGSGVRKSEVSNYRLQHNLQNIVQLPFQPREKVHISLGAADFQVVIMGDGQVGFTHPNKVYGALYIGKPIVYIGPSSSHIADLLEEVPGNIMVNHGQAQQLANMLSEMASNKQAIEKIGQSNREYARQTLEPEMLRSQLVEELENHFAL